MNTSIVSNIDTATTNPESAAKRAENMACFGIKDVLELCVGPSLRTLVAAYQKHGIYCTGNDIEARWSRWWPHGHWKIGDALKIPWGLDYVEDESAVVFAPPLSRGCTGTRADSLRIDDVEPAYTAFLNEAIRRYYKIESVPRILCMVLPARCLATREDRTQFYSLLNKSKELGRIYVDELKAGRRQIRKYVDVYIERF